MFAVYVRRNDNYDVTLSHSFKDSIKVYIQNDTLRIRSLMNDDYYDLRPYSHRNTYPIQLTVDCPSVSSVYSNQNYVSIAGFKQKNLKFIASNRASILNNTIDDFELVVNKKGIVNFGKNGDRTAKEEEPEVSEKNYLNTFGILQINLDTSSTVIFKNSFEVNKILLKTSKNNHLDGLDEDLIRKIEVLK
jgi:hypothetical protein